MTQDTLLHATLMGGQSRVLLCQSTKMVKTACKTHDMTPLATAALGRLITISAMMGSMCKSDEEQLTLTIKGSGPIGALVAVAKAGGVVKAYVDNPRIDLPLTPKGKLDVGGAVGHEGRLMVVRDLGLKEPYVAQTALVSGEIAEDFAYFFTVSEQTPSLVSLGVRVRSEGVVCAGGLLIQPMPGCSEALLVTLEAITPMFENISGQLEEAPSPHALLHSLFNGLDPVILEEKTPQYLCDCSRERLSRVVVSLGEEEITSIIKEQGSATLTCHFCQTTYEFTVSQLQGLLQYAKG